MQVFAVSSGREWGQNQEPKQQKAPELASKARYSRKQSSAAECCRSVHVPSPCLPPARDLPRGLAVASISGRCLATRGAIQGGTNARLRQKWNKGASATGNA